MHAARCPMKPSDTERIDSHRHKNRGSSSILPTHQRQHEGRSADRSDMGVKRWHHPAETINFLTEDNEDTSTIQIFTDGSKSEQGVGAGTAIFESGKPH